MIGRDPTSIMHTLSLMTRAVRRTTSLPGLGLVVPAMVVMSAGAAFAQSPPPGRVEIAGGLQWTGGMSIGEEDATETTPSSTRYRLFSTRTTLAPATGLEGRVAVRVSRLVDAAVSTVFAKSNLRSAATSDVEGIPDVEATDSITQIAIEGAVMVNLPRLAFSERALPFVSAGAGFLRHLHEGRTFVENGSIYHVGAGLSYLLSSRGTGALKSTGVRLDARAVFRRNGVAFDDGSHVSPAFGVSFFGRF